MSRPILAVMSQVDLDESGELRPVITHEIENLCNAIDADVIIISPKRHERLDRILSIADGLLVCGTLVGSDAYYETKDTSIASITGESMPERDRVAMRALTIARERGIPTLAICHGMQLMSLAAGGTLRYVEGHLSDGDWDERSHAMILSPRLADEIGLSRSEVRVNSKHAIAIGWMPKGFDILGWWYAGDETPVPEMISDMRHPFYVGLQWHPEFLMDDVVTRAMVGRFKEAMGKHASDAE